MPTPTTRRKTAAIYLAEENPNRTEISKTLPSPAANSRFTSSIFTSLIYVATVLPVCSLKWRHKCGSEIPNWADWENSPNFSQISYKTLETIPNNCPVSSRKSVQATTVG